jgi:hypothetical protein
MAKRRAAGYRRTKADIHHGYVDMPSTPLFAFGHGLSYTTFDYGPLKLDTDSIDVGGEIRASVQIGNSGSRDGTEIVQLYAADTPTGVTLSAQQLVGFVDAEVGQLVPSVDQKSSAVSRRGLQGRAGQLTVLIEGQESALPWSERRLPYAGQRTHAPPSRRCY